MSTAVATAAASAAAIAAQQAQEAARRAECQGIFANFDPKGASAEAMRVYATCVRDVHGLHDPWTPQSLLVAKLIVVILLVGAVAGFIVGTKEDGPIFGVLCSLLGAFGGALAILALAAVAFVLGAS